MASKSNETAMQLLATGGPMMQPSFPGAAGLPRPMMPANYAATIGMIQANQFNQMMMSQNVPPRMPTETQYCFNHPFMVDPSFSVGVDPSFSVGFHPYMSFDRRKSSTRETTKPLKTWLSDHIEHPYPTKKEKCFFAYTTGMTMTQVSTWFANARRRLRKEDKSWSQRHSPNDSDDEDEGDDSTPDVSLSDEKSAGIVVDALESPKKPKIWSIADTLNLR